MSARLPEPVWFMAWLSRDSVKGADNMPGGQQPNSWSRNDRLAAWAIAATLFTGVICFIAAIANHETRVFVGLEKPTRPAHIDTSNKPASVTPPVNQPASAVPVPAGQSEKTHPADADTHNNLGYGYYEQKRYAEAEAEFKK